MVGKIVILTLIFFPLFGYSQIDDLEIQKNEKESFKRKVSLSMSLTTLNTIKFSDRQGNNILSENGLTVGIGSEYFLVTNSSIELNTGRVSNYSGAFDATIISSIYTSLGIRQYFLKERISLGTGISGVKYSTESQYSNYSHLALGLYINGRYHINISKFLGFSFGANYTPTYFNTDIYNEYQYLWFIDSSMKLTLGR